MVTNFRMVQIVSPEVSVKTASNVDGLEIFNCDTQQYRFAVE